MGRPDLREVRRIRSAGFARRNQCRQTGKRAYHRIGGGESTWDVPADYLTIVCPISDEDRQQLKQQEYRNRLRDKELTEHIRKLVVQFEDQNFETEGHSVLISDEYHDACYVYGFRVNEDVLYALLDYDDGRLRTVPVSDLCVVELFDAFWLLVQNA